MTSTVEKTFSYLQEEDIDKAAEMLTKAKRIFIYAFGDSQIRAKSFQNKMLKVNKYVIIATELSEWAYHTQNITAEDCVIFLSYHGQSEILAKAADYLKGEGIPLLLITAANSKNELKQRSTV